MTRFIKDENEDSLDERGLVRDGHVLRCGMMFKDSVDPVQQALDATEALKMRDAAILAASRKPGFHYADSTLDSQATARAAARQASYDIYDREISTAYLRKEAVIADAAVDPRQAWHAARANRTADANDAHAAVMDAAYAAVDEELRNAWRKPAQF
jgi:hypothetical protein